MKEVPRIKSRSKPNSVEFLGNGYYYYNFDIQESLEFNPETKKEEPIYSFIQVRIFGSPNYKDSVKHVIRQYVSQEEEFDLINSYNQSNLLGVKDTKYQNYLELLNNIKEKIKVDFSKNIF